MVARITGISDQVRVLDEGGVEVGLGWIQSASHTIDNKTEPKPAIGGGANFQYNLDGVVEVSGSIEVVPTSFQIFKLMGEDDQVNKTITLTDTLPTFTVQMNITNSEYIELTGVKFGSAKISISKGEQPKISFDFQGLDASQVSGTITYTKPSEPGFDYTDAKVKIGGVYVGSVDSIDITIDRELELVRGIENQDNRKASEVIEKLKNISFSITIEITDTTAWNEVMGSSLGTTRSDTTLTLELGGNSIQLTGVRFGNLSADKSADGDVRTVSCDGVALGALITYA